MSVGWNHLLIDYPLITQRMHHLKSPLRRLHRLLKTTFFTKQIKSKRLTPDIHFKIRPQQWRPFQGFSWSELKKQKDSSSWFLIHTARAFCMASKMARSPRHLPAKPPIFLYRSNIIMAADGDNTTATYSGITQKINPDLEIKTPLKGNKQNCPLTKTLSSFVLCHFKHSSDDCIFFTKCLVFSEDLALDYDVIILIHLSLPRKRWHGK